MKGTSGTQLGGTQAKVARFIRRACRAQMPLKSLVHPKKHFPGTQLVDRVHCPRYTTRMPHPRPGGSAPPCCRRSPASGAAGLHLSPQARRIKRINGAWSRSTPAPQADLGKLPTFPVPHSLSICRSTAKAWRSTTRSTTRLAGPPPGCHWCPSSLLGRQKEMGLC